MNKENYKAIFADKDFINAFTDFLVENIYTTYYVDAETGEEAVEITLCNKPIVNIITGYLSNY